MRTYSAGTAPENAAADHPAPNANFLYVTDEGSNDIKAYKIAPSCKLSTIGTYSAGGTGPFGVAVDPTGSYAVAANLNSSTVSFFSIGTTGALTLAGTTTAGGSNPVGVAISGGYIRAQREQRYRLRYTSSGSLFGSYATDSYPQGVAVDPVGSFAYVANEFGNDVSGYTVAGGVLTPTSPATFAAGTAPDSSRRVRRRVLTASHRRYRRDFLASGCAGAVTPGGIASVVPPSSPVSVISGVGCRPRSRAQRRCFTWAIRPAARRIAGSSTSWRYAVCSISSSARFKTTTCPEGMTTDAAGNLYVADLGVSTEGQAHGDIKVYRKARQSTRVTSSPPIGCRTISPLEATARCTSRTSRHSPSFRRARSRFTAGRQSALTRVAAAQLSSGRHNAPRQTNTIYISYQGNGSNGDIAEFKHARGKAIDLGVSYPEPWAILEDGSDNLLALDGSGTVEVYSEATGKLVQQITVPNGAAWEAFNQNHPNWVCLELRPSGSPELSRREGRWVDQRGIEHFELPDRRRLLAAAGGCRF